MPLDILEDSNVTAGYIRPILSLVEGRAAERFDHHGIDAMRKLPKLDAFRSVRSTLRRWIVPAVVCTVVSLPALAGAKDPGTYRTGWYADMKFPGELSEIEQLGSNFVLPYGTDAVLGDHTDATVGGFLDEAERQDLDVMVPMPRSDRGRQGDDSTVDASAIESLVREYHDHPALYGWYLADEPGIHTKPTPTDVAEVRRAIRRVDSTNPTHIVHWARPKEDYASSYDTLMVDWYPREKKTGDNDVGEFNWMMRRSPLMWERADEFTEQHDKNGWIAVLGAQSEDGKKGDRYPSYDNFTLDEYRYYALSALAHDAKAMLYWIIWSSWTSQTIENRVTKIQKLVRKIGPYLDHGTKYPSSIGVDRMEGELLYRHGAVDETHYLLAINIVGHDRGGFSNSLDPDDVGKPLNDVAFDLSQGAVPDQIEVVGENRTLSVSDGTFQDDFGRYEAHVYRYTTGGSDSDGSGNDDAENDVPVTTAVRAGSAMDVDGRLEEATWSRARTISVPEGAEQGNTGRTKFAWDDEYLYFGAAAVDETVAGSDEDRLWTNDGFEVGFDTDRDRTTSPDGDDYKLIVDHAGRLRFGSTESGEASWSAETVPAELEGAARVDADGFVVEARVPWSAFGVDPTSGSSVGMFVMNNDLDSRDDSATHRTWPADSGSHDPSRWGRLVLQAGHNSGDTGWGDTGIDNGSPDTGTSDPDTTAHDPPDAAGPFDGSEAGEARRSDAELRRSSGCATPGNGLPVPLSALVVLVIGALTCRRLD